MHSDGRFGYRVRSEQRPANAVARKPCDPIRAKQWSMLMAPALASMITGSGRPKRPCSLRAGSTLPSLARPPSTTETRAGRPLVARVNPHMLAGLLGVVKVCNADHLQPKERKDDANAYSS